MSDQKPAACCRTKAIVDELRDWLGRLTGLQAKERQTDTDVDQLISLAGMAGTMYKLAFDGSTYHANYKCDVVASDQKCVACETSSQARDIEQLKESLELKRDQVNTYIGRLAAMTKTVSELSEELGVLKAISAPQAEVKPGEVPGLPCLCATGSLARCARRS